MIFLREDGSEQRPQLPLSHAEHVLNPGNIRRPAGALPPDLPELAALLDVVKNEPFDPRCCRGYFGSRGVSQWQRVRSGMACEESVSIGRGDGGRKADRRVGGWLVASRESWIISRELSALLRDWAILARQYPALSREYCSAMLECNLAFCSEAFKVSGWTLPLEMI
jgi:hypothetical protein